MKVLFLTPWYPSERDAMAGLFVQKHVEAVRAQGVDVRVIDSQSWCGIWRQWRALKHEWGLPDVVQLNVIQKQGLLALWLKKRYGIPYVIVEHWSGYLLENGQFMRMSRVQKKLYRHVAAQAAIVLPVSQCLAKAMQECGMRNTHWGKIHNVVDDFFYQHSAFSIQHSEKKTFLHVSCFDERAKNVKGLLRAVKALSEKRRDWRLVLVGTGVDYDEVRAYARELEIPQDLLHWTGELSPKELSEWFGRTDAFVLTSRYETYGVVLAEAYAAGVPILSTPVGIAQEVVNERTGLIISHENAQRPKRLAEYMEHVLTMPHYTGHAEDFRAEHVGKALKTVYQSCTDLD